MQELRILSGYHRGATLPLDEGATLAIGAEEDADVVLADPGIAGRHARLSCDVGAWMLEPADGEVRGQDNNIARDRVLLADGAFARVGAIWLAICDSDAPWQDPPAEPVDGPSQEADRNATGPDEEPAEGGAATNMQAQPAESAATEVAPPVRPSRGLRVVLIPVTAMAVLSAAAAYALTGHPAADGETAVREAAEAGRLVAMPRRLPPDELQAALRKRLAEIDLLSRLAIDLRDQEWTIRGALSDDDAERLQRALRAFSDRYVVDFPVHVKIGSAEAMLPFRIVQVIAGDDPSIVIDDGRRLYVGDEYRGVRLAAMAGNQLKFTGKQTLNVAW